jgi:hypothetical protein
MSSTGLTQARWWLAQKAKQKEEAAAREMMAEVCQQDRVVPTCPIRPIVLLT